MKHTSRGMDCPLMNPMMSPFNDSDSNSQDSESGLTGQDTPYEGLDKDEDAYKPPSPQAFILETCNNLIF